MARQYQALYIRIKEAEHYKATKVFMMPDNDATKKTVRNATQQKYSKLCRDINTGTITLHEAMELYPVAPKEDKKMDFEKDYTCPDCGDACKGEDMIYNIASGTLYVCPHCGCIQNERDVERQLKDEEE